MRVIAGEFRSRRLKTLPGVDVRPTPDRLRESLFSVLAPQLPGCVFLDTFAGSGAVGIEALSRGAAKAIFLEKSREAVEVIRENLASLDALGRVEVVRGYAAKLLPKYPADIVFLDPPYPLDKEYRDCLDVLGAAPPKLLIVQHDRHRVLAGCYGQLERYRELRQGDNVLSFFQPA